MHIEITLDAKPHAEAQSDSKTIYISKGRIALLESEVEFAALLAHELGHIKYGHYSIVPYAYTIVPGISSQSFFWLSWRLGKFFRGLSPPQTFEEYLYSIETRQEIQADEFMAHSLPQHVHAAHVFADVLERLMRLSGMLETQHEPCTRMHRARIMRLREIEQEKNHAHPN